MKRTLIAKSEVTIKAPSAKVWKALTDPSMIKKYLFGTRAVSDWKEGSSIRYRGKWKGKMYEDKGQVIDVVPGKVLATTYWSSMSGKSDDPENYQNVIYALEPVDAVTKLTVTQDGNMTSKEKSHSEKNWKAVLTALKKLLEK